MDKSLIESYKAEMMKMYKIKSKPAAVTEKVSAMPQSSKSSGGLIGVATQIRGLYFLPNTKVTVFTGSVDNMQIIDTAYTNENGRTREFILPTPKIGLSLDENNTQVPYSLYNMMFEADGYLTNIHLNVPVFASVTSRQTSNLLLLETAGINKEPRIFNEALDYNL